MDRIHAEIHKVAGPVTLETFHSLLNIFWEEEDMPKDFRGATVVPLFKNKGSRAEYWTDLGISLLSISGKILAHVIMNHLITSILEDNLSEA